MVAHRIRELMHRPFVLDDREVVLTTSIGIAVSGDGVDAASLLKHADTAMYHAKDEGRDNCQFYSASLTQRAQQRLNMENNLRRRWSAKSSSLSISPSSISRAGASIRWRP